jgi:radical SAM protein with 4Fe4S-binding SPASM domain
MSTVPPFPRVLRIEPASRCNLACSHCPTGTVDMARGVMDEEVFARVLAEIEAHRPLVRVVVLYHGGEPLLNRSFVDYVDRIKAVDPSIFVKTVSNGMALTRAAVDRLLATDLDLIEFSLDGVSPDESEFVREKSRTRTILDNVDRFLAEKARQGRANPVVAIASTFGDQVQYKTTWALQWPHMGETPQYDLVRVGGEDADMCDHVVSTMTVRSDGVVVPCCYDLTSRLPMGNVRSQRLADIWQGDGYRTLREAIAAKRYPSICAGCATVRPPTYLVPRWTAVAVPVALASAGTRGRAETAVAADAAGAADVRPGPSADSPSASPA